MNLPSGLSRVSRDDLGRLLDALTGGRLRAPISADGLVANGLAHLCDHADIFQGLNLVATHRLVSAVIAERECALHPKLHLVWSGPEAIASEAQDTRAVLVRLFENARSHVLVGGYSFDHGEDILAPLHAAMRDYGVKVDMFLNVDPPKTREGDLLAHCTLAVDRFLTANWPFGDPKPTIYFDPRTASTAVYASLHAKCVVADGHLSLITSANFTARAQHRNIEAGVLIDDASFAARFVAHWHGLVSHGLVSRYGG